MPESTSIFLVVGSAGEYDDYEQWVVAAWPTQEEADQHAADARSEVSRIENERVRQRLSNHVVVVYSPEITFMGRPYR